MDQRITSFAKTRLRIPEKKNNTRYCIASFIHTYIHTFKRVRRLGLPTQTLFVTTVDDHVTPRFVVGGISHEMKKQLREPVL